MKKQLLLSLSEISAQNMMRINEIVETRMNELEMMADSLEDADVDAFQELILEFQGISNLLEFKEMGIATVDGDAYMSTATEFDINERAYFQKALEGESNISDVLVDMKDGEYINVYSTPIHNADGTVIGVLFGVDCTSQFSKIFQTTSFNGEGYTYLIDSEGEIVFKSDTVDDDFENLFTYLKEHKQDQVLSEITEDMQSDIAESYFIEGYGYINMNPSKINDWWVVSVAPESVLTEQVNGVMHTVQLVIGNVFVLSLIGLIVYMYNRRKYDTRLQKFAYVDMLTGLYNKEYLNDNFDKIIKKLNGKYIALIAFDVYKFKVINEIYGEDTGNVILKKIAMYLKKENKKHELVIREHADEFVGIYTYNSKEELEERLKGIINGLDIIQYQKNRVKVKLSIGVYDRLVKAMNIYSFERVSGYARIAKSENKKDKGSMFHYYTNELRERELENKKLVDSIQDAIKRKEFKAWFQPQFHVKTKKMVAAEALARWYTSDGRILTPYHFVDFCEKSGMIQEVDQLILEDVCAKLQSWIKRGLPCVPIAVNLSRAYLNNVDSIYQVKKIVDSYGVPTSLIKLEITESAIANSEEELGDIIRVMHELGFTVSLDDFGVGYSSLFAINNLNFDVLKIDKSFVDAIGTKKGNYLVSYTIHLAKQLGMKLIAEGIETEEQYEYLSKLGCDTIQGYFFSKPLSETEFENILEKLEENCNLK